MVRYLALLTFFFLIISCQNSKTINFNKYTLSKNSIYVDVVQKNIVSNYSSDDIYSNLTNDYILDWVNHRIKTNGYNGDLLIRIDSISADETKITNGIKININVNISFIISRSVLDNKIIITLNGNEYGQITGNYSIDDKSIEVENTIKRLIDKLSLKLSSELY
tara:strand:+ start:2874 stop:3365 length:492 start_codon:yes stop_codon:yes gene_type:complete